MSLDLVTLKALAHTMRLRYPNATIRISEQAGAVCFQWLMAGAAYPGFTGTFVRSLEEWDALQRDVDAAIGAPKAAAKSVPFGGSRGRW